MNERIVSERVVSTKKVEKQGYVQEKWGNLKDSISAFCMAPILILVAIGLLFYSEGFHKSSEVLQDLSVQSPDEVVGQSGMKMIEGTARIESALSAPGVGDVLYFDLKKETYEEVEEKEYETRTRTEDGQEYEDKVETTKIVEKWVEKEGVDGKWANFYLGEIKIVPKDASLRLDYVKKIFVEGENGELVEAKGETPALGDKRVVVQYLPLKQKILVVGELQDNKIAGGSEFIITDKSADDLMNTVQNEETFWYWFLKFIIWLLFTIGMTSIVGPIIALVDFIPLVGTAARNVAGFISAVLALIIVLVASILIKFWWLFVIVVVLTMIVLVGLLIFLWMRIKKKNI